MKKIRINRRKRNLFEKMIGKPIPFTLIIVLMLFASMIAYMYMLNSLNRQSTENLSRRRECSLLEQENILLESEINNLKSPSRIRKYAQENLGLISSKPKTEAVVIVNKK